MSDHIHISEIKRELDYYRKMKRLAEDLPEGSPRERAATQLLLSAAELLALKLDEIIQ